MVQDIIQSHAGKLYHKGVDFVEGRCGSPIFPGDYVECMTPEYYSIRKGKRARVMKIDGQCIVLSNKYSPMFDSPYRAENFRLSGRYHPYHHGGVDKRRPAGKYDTNSEKEAKIMLHIAFPISDGQNYSNIADAINSARSHVSMMADVTASALKERVKLRIKNNPEERWLILSGNTIAETSAPPIAFRQW